MGVKVEHVAGDRYRVRVLAGTDPETGRAIRKTRYFHAASKTAANKVGARYEAELRSQVTDGRERREVVAGLIDDWWRHHEAACSPTTLYRERPIVDRIRQQLGPVRLDELSGQHIDRFYTWLRTTKFERSNQATRKPLSESTIHHHHRVLKSILRTGERWDRLAGDATRKAKTPRKPRALVQPPTNSEIASLIAAADHDWGTMFAFFAKTGCRRGEVCALRWSDLRNGVITISKSEAFVSGQLVSKDTKTHEPRRLPLDDDMKRLLSEWRTVLEAKSQGLGASLHKDAYLFPNLAEDRGGLAPRRPDTVSQAWARLCAANGVKARLHDLRHWNASVLLASGVPLRAVADHLGHSLPSTTTNIYAHTVGDAGIREALQRALPVGDPAVSS